MISQASQETRSGGTLTKTWVSSIVSPKTLSMFTHQVWGRQCKENTSSTRLPSRSIWSTHRRTDSMIWVVVSPTKTFSRCSCAVVISWNSEVWWAISSTVINESMVVNVSHSASGSQVATISAWAVRELKSKKLLIISIPIKNHLCSLKFHQRLARQTTHLATGASSSQTNNKPRLQNPLNKLYHHHHKLLPNKHSQLKVTRKKPPQFSHSKTALKFTTKLLRRRLPRKSNLNLSLRHQWHNNKNKLLVNLRKHLPQLLSQIKLRCWSHLLLSYNKMCSGSIKHWMSCSLRWSPTSSF